MSWDEKLFLAGLKAYRKVLPKYDPSHNPKSQFLEEVREKLQILARALTGNNIQIFPAKEEGGLGRLNFYLPYVFDHFSRKSENFDFYVFRIIYMSVQFEFELDFTKYAGLSLKQLRKEASRDFFSVIERVQYLYPEYALKLNKIIEKEKIYQQTRTKKKENHIRYLCGRFIIEKTQEKETIGTESGFLKPGKISTELEIKAIEEKEIITKDQKKIEEYTLMHHFDKTETLDEFQGKWQYMDSEDELEHHENALEEVDFKKIVRTDEQNTSLVKGSQMFDSSIGDVEDTFTEEEVFLYDEWDAKKRKYKKGHCKVYPRYFTKKEPQYAENVLRKYKVLKSRMLKIWHFLLNEYQRKKNQLSGEEPDIDKVVQRFVDMKIKRKAEENIYIAKRKKLQEIELLILMDLSLSTDSYIKDFRIIDVECESIILLSDILFDMNISFQIDGFSSRTRNYCDYTHIKRFEESWAVCKDRLGALQPIGYTRIGTALRHAGCVLERRVSRNLWTLLISDAKPNDYDRYEGSYGVGDIKQAVKEFKQKNISMYSMTIEPQSKGYLSQMFGKGNFQILKNPSQLPMAMMQFASRLVFSR